MSLLTSKFDVLRGWPDGGHLEEDFEPTANSVIVAGSIGFVQSDGTWSPVNHTVLSGGVPTEGSNTGGVSLWVALEGNGTSDFDVAASGKVTCLKCMQLVVQTDQFVSHAYSPGDLLTVSDGNAGSANMPTGSAGQITYRASTEQVIGQVLSYDSANGLLVCSLDSK